MSEERDTRIAIIGIVVENLSKFYLVNAILHEYSKLFAGRMGIPYKEREISVITLIAEGTNDEISAVTGKLGRVEGVSVKAMLTKVK
jgi:putative iron-only hydrogenase system regulator